ncbi:hypothetical protein RND71_038628 [Anisodus tanguticus]|uniref:Dirigent protein n=1 Tax=Anisodus tanguticus TaxID=243964 RepID=A0AAE1R309_9SOLA|nr:hypothetical protein RND71_038628 [Anisodus tanguticus]
MAAVPSQLEREQAYAYMLQEMCREQVTNLVGTLLGNTRPIDGPHCHVYQVAYYQLLLSLLIRTLAPVADPPADSPTETEPDSAPAASVAPPHDLTNAEANPQANTVLQNSGNNNIVNGGINQPFVTAGQLPSGPSLRQLMFGSITVVDNEITEGHELGLAVLHRAQGFYLTSSSDGTSHTLALAALFHHDHELDHSVSFFGIHRTATATPISHIAIIGGTGKYENAKGYATTETLPQDQHTADGVEIITHFTVYLTP